MKSVFVVVSFAVAFVVVGFFALSSGSFSPISYVSAPLPPKPPIHKIKFKYPPTPEQKAMLDWLAAETARDRGFEWRTPIDFNGLVIDETGNPIEGAAIEWTTTTVSGNGHGMTTSDSTGRFSIKTRGKVMDIQVKKEGYSNVDGAVQGFEFADFTQDNYYDGDKDHPVISHLEKIPPPEPFYFIGGGAKQGLVGHENWINPKQRSKVGWDETSEGMWIQFTPHPQTDPESTQYDVILGTAPGGGIILLPENKFKIVAPTSGYTNPLKLDVLLDPKNQRIMQKVLFFRDGAGHYGKMELEINLIRDEPTISYMIIYNPSGTRNLSGPHGGGKQINN